MAIVLYRDGTSHTVRGVVCEAKRFSHREVDYQLASGWRLSPESINEVIIEEINEEINKEETDDETPEAIRLKAKEFGLKDWDKKRIKTLKLEMKYEPEN